MPAHHNRSAATVLLVMASCLAVICPAQAASKKCMVAPPGARVSAAGIAGWTAKPSTFSNAGALAFVAGELYEADAHFQKQKCPPHTGLTPDERMDIKVMGVCTKVKTATQSSLYRVQAMIGYPCKGRKASTLKTASGTYKCGKNRFCVKLYITADAPFSFDFTALNSVASGGEGEGEGYGEVLSNVLDLHIETARYT